MRLPRLLHGASSYVHCPACSVMRSGGETTEVVAGASSYVHCPACSVMRSGGETTKVVAWSLLLCSLSCM